jgi:hypothetical protein
MNGADPGDRFILGTGSVQRMRMGRDYDRQLANANAVMQSAQIMRDLGVSTPTVALTKSAGSTPQVGTTVFDPYTGTVTGVAYGLNPTSDYAPVSGVFYATTNYDTTATPGRVVRAQRDGTALVDLGATWGPLSSPASLATVTAGMPPVSATTGTAVLGTSPSQAAAAELAGLQAANINTTGRQAYTPDVFMSPSTWNAAVTSVTTDMHPFGVAGVPPLTPAAILASMPHGGASSAAAQAQTLASVSNAGAPLVVQSSCPAPVDCSTCAAGWK